jgi:predicted nicotinamide N-methyase
MNSSSFSHHSSPERVQLKEFSISIDTQQQRQSTSRTLIVRQIISDNYGLFVWPSALVLAEYIRYIGCNGKLGVDRSLLVELGAGTCLPGMIGALFGAHVVLTDKADEQQVLQNIQQTCTANRSNFVVGQRDSTPTVMPLTWGHLEQASAVLETLMARRQASVTPTAVDNDDDNILQFAVIGADLFYLPALFEDAVATVAFLLSSWQKKNTRRQQHVDLSSTAARGSAVFITAYEERSASQTMILYRLLRWFHLEVNEVALSTFYPDIRLQELAGKTIRL